MSETPVIPSELLFDLAPPYPSFRKWMGRVYMVQSVEVADDFSVDGYHNEDMRLRVDNVPGYLVRKDDEVLFIHHAVMLSLMDDTTTGLKLVMACHMQPKVWTATDPLSFGRIGNIMAHPAPRTRQEVATAAFERLQYIGAQRYASARLKYIVANTDASVIQFEKQVHMPGWTRRALTHSARLDQCDVDAYRNDPI